MNSIEDGNATSSPPNYATISPRIRIFGHFAMLGQKTLEGFDPVNNTVLPHKCNEAVVEPSQVSKAASALVLQLHGGCSLVTLTPD